MTSAVRSRALARGLVLVLFLLLTSSAATPLLGAEFDSGRADFFVQANGETIPYEVFALFLMPGENLSLEAPGPKGTNLVLSTEGEVVPSSRPGRWNWRAPTTPGLRVLEIAQSQGSGRMTLNVFVLVPAANVVDQKLNGYRIGRYPGTPFRGLSVYRPPSGFVEVTPENSATAVSPHFTLGQFLCKQADGFPKYVVLRERLLLKLEFLLALVNERGHRADTFAVLSGFRTPFYNASIGNVPNSRHQWGGAADIFIDESPKDGVMDDLDGNGKVDLADSQYLYRLFEGVTGSPEHREFVGGLGVYGSTSAHGPFVHVDARGYRARWGKL